MTAAPIGQLPAATIESLVQRAESIASAAGRGDLASRLAGARARVARPETVVAIVGEFKRGKSSLVNGLLGSEVCPVDDDIATAALTVVRHGPETVISLRGEDGAMMKASTSLAEVRDFVTERARRGEKGAEFVEIRVDNPFLSRGLMLVDTPGVGGLSAGYAGLTLGYLHAADALIFVSDASAPLVEAEIEFLRRATAICPAAIMALTKVDLHPEWRRIRDLSAAALQAAGLELPVMPVSAVLRMAAFERKDAELNVESGFPELLAQVASRILDPVRDRAVQRAVAELSSAVAQLAGSLVIEEAGLVDVSQLEPQMAKLAKERERLEHLRGAGSRWQTILNDSFSDLVADVEHSFRQAVRLANKDADEVIEGKDPADEWDGLAADMRQRMADASVAVVRDLEAGTDAIATRILEILREEELAYDPALGKATPLEVSALWSAKSPEVRFVMDNVATGWASLRGAQGGILVFGMLGSLAGLALTTGAMAGLGVIFGGKQMFDERKRQVTSRRQKARNAVRQFLDDVQFEVGKSMRDLSRELQRQLRDHFGERITESIRSCATTAEALQRGLKDDEAARIARRTVIQKHLEALREISAQLDRAEVQSAR